MKYAVFMALRGLFQDQGIATYELDCFRVV
jgi:hypothetical protein